MAYTNPPSRGNGQSGHLADHELIRLALVDIGTRLTAIEASIVTLEARPVVYVQASAPTGVTGAGWLDMP